MSMKGDTALVLDEEGFLLEALADGCISKDEYQQELIKLYITVFGYTDAALDKDRANKLECGNL